MAAAEARYLALDLGAESGRAVLGYFDGEKDPVGGCASVQEPADKGFGYDALGCAPAIWRYKTWFGDGGYILW